MKANTTLHLPKANRFMTVLDDMIVSSQEIASKAVDFTYENPEIEMFTDGMIMFDGRKFDMTDIATEQLCSKLGMPIKYFNKLFTSENDAFKSLAVYNITTLGKSFNRGFMVRTVDETARAILSPRYTPFDSDKVLDVIHSVVKHTNSIDLNHRTLRMRGYGVGLNGMHMRFTTQNPLMDDLYAGLQVDSSDVGRGSLKVSFFIFKQICTNGMVIGKFDKELYYQRHLNISSDEFKQGLERSISVFPSLVSDAQEIVSTAESKSIRESRLFNLDENETFKATIKKYLDVGDKDIEDIVTIASTTYSPTVWGFANAITQKAQDYDLDKRIQLERIAGDFLFDYKRLGVA